jgi:HPt (histidine-containing phosphotransfer) domain-containing protein
VGEITVSDLFAERFAAVRARFAAKLDSRIDEIEATIPELAGGCASEPLARAHRRAHDLCGVGPTMGFVATGHAARAIEQVMLGALKANRPLSADELTKVSDGVAALRVAACAETAPQPTTQE